MNRKEPDPKKIFRPGFGTNKRHRLASLSLIRYSFQRNRDNSQGSALIWALIIVTVLMGTAVAISRRGLFGVVGSSFVRDSKLAREAAEIGILRTVAILNEPRNRRLLVNANKLNTNTKTTIESDSSLVSDCVGAGSGPTLQAALATLKTDSGFPVVDIDTERTYQIISISQPNSSNETDVTFNLGLGTNTTSAQSGEITITVKGTAKRGTQIVGEFTLQRTLEVIPKCCGLSLGGKSNAFGGEIRQCDADNSGLGLIAGVYYKNNGELDTTGGSGIRFYSDTAKTVPTSNVYCIDTSTTNDCLDGALNSGTGTKLKEVGTQIPDVPTSPVSTICQNKTITSNCTVTIEDNLTLSTSDFANWGTSAVVAYSTATSTTVTTAPSIVYSTTTFSKTTIICTGKNTPTAGCSSASDTVVKNQPTTVTNSTTTTAATTITNTTAISTGVSLSTTNVFAAKLKSLCSQLVESGTTVTYCSLDRLIIENNKSLLFDTAGGPIRIYFVDPSTEGDPSIELKNGQSGLGQIKGGVATQNYGDMALYGISANTPALTSGCPSSGPCQYVELGGGNSGSTSFFAYFPGGSVELQGNTTTQGMIWANQISATGSVDFVSTSSGVGSVLSLLGITSQNNPGSSEPILVEYITRLSKRFRFF
jgi:hypothetical protein